MFNHGDDYVSGGNITRYKGPSYFTRHPIRARVFISVGVICAFVAYAILQVFVSYVQGVASGETRLAQQRIAVVKTTSSYLASASPAEFKKYVAQLRAPEGLTYRVSDPVTYFNVLDPSKTKFTGTGSPTAFSFTMYDSMDSLLYSCTPNINVCIRATNNASGAQTFTSEALRSVPDFIR